MRDIEQLQRQHTEPATEAVVSECFMHSLYSFGIWPGEIMWLFAYVKNGCAILYYIYIVWHDKQIYIQHFKIMKNVQPGHLHISLSLSSSLWQRKEEFNYIFLGETYTELLGRILRASRGSCAECGSMMWLLLLLLLLLLP